MSSRFAACLLLPVMLFFLFCSDKQAPPESTKRPVLLITSDYGSIRRCATVEKVYSVARTIISAKPDIVAMDATANGLVSYNSKIGHRVPDSPFEALFAAGIEPYEIMTDTLKSHGITVVANVRMNDHHGNPLQWTQWERDHREWSLAKDTGARDWKAIGALRHLDYAIKGVRDFRFSILKEILEKFNVDGFQLDFGRTAPFLSAPKREKAKFMTQYIRDIRSLLNDASRKSGREMTLGALVPWDYDFCKKEGLNVDDWVNEGLIDYVSPGEWYYADWNIPLDKWKALTDGAACRLYPFTPGNVSPYQAFEYGEVSLLGENRALDGPKIRAIADNFMAQEPDGFAFYNFYVFDFGRYYPSLRQWTDPARNSGLSRHYYFCRRPVYQPNERETFDLGIAFERVPFKKDGDTVMLPFRFSTVPSGTSARLRAALKNMDRADEISVSLNGMPLPAGTITPEMYISAEDDTVHFCVWESPESAGILKKGINELTITLLKEHRGKNRYIAAGEFEIWVKDK